MRKSREETALTRLRIVEAASRLFRARGIGAVSVADIMGSLGLTVGGFYRHFDSKDALVAEAIDSASQQTARRLGTMDEVVAGYLSMAHRSNLERGCPVAALCSEVAHQGRRTKRAFTVAMERLLVSIERLSPAMDRQRALSTAAAAVGALVLSRATADEDLAREILEAVGSSLKGRAS